MLKIKEIIAEILEIEEIDFEFSQDFNFKEHERWDSLCALNLIVAFEENFKIFLNDEDLSSVKTIEDLEGLLRGKK